MASVKITVNSADKRRVAARSRKVLRELRSPSGLVFKYAGRVANDFCEVVMSGMGTIDGSSRASDTLSEGDFSFSINWKPLAPFTLLLKKRDGYSANFWYRTGETKAAVDTQTTGTSIFAGINGMTDRAAYEHAKATEFGTNGTDTWAGRALFTLAANSFKENRNEIYEALRRQAELTFIKAGWGR